MATLDFDYTKDSGLNDEMIRTSSPINDYISQRNQDNIEFEARNETDSMAYQRGTYQSNTSDTRVEINQPDNSIYIWQNNVIVAYFTGQTLGFNTPNGTGAGSIFGFGTEQLGVFGSVVPGDDATYDLGSSGLQWDDIYCVDLHESSDRRIKENIQPISYGLEEILQLEPVEFDMKKGGAHKLGLIAQDVAKIIPMVAHDTEDESKTATLSYTGLIPVLIKAIHELAEANDALVERVEWLEDKASVL